MPAATEVAACIGGRHPQACKGGNRAGGRCGGAAGAEAIDTAMRLVARHPMGPLELADLIGLDTCLSVMQVLHEGLAHSK